MAEKDLAVAIIKEASAHLGESKTLSQLKDNYIFFKSDVFEFWADIAEIRESTKRIIQEHATERYKILKKILYACELKPDKFNITRTGILIIGCPRRALYHLFRHAEDAVLFMEIKANGSKIIIEVRI